MKQKLLNSFVLRVCLLVVFFASAVSGAWADNTYTLGWGTASGDAGTYTNFMATSGSVTNIVSFSTAKNDAGTAPAYNSNNSDLRLYYNAQGNGGSITLKPATGVTITGFVMTTSTSPSVKYTVDSGTATSVTASDNTYTVNNISASSSLMIQNVNTSNTQLRIKTIQITYSVAAPAYTINAESNNDSYGTVSLTGSVITATPAEGYTYADPAYTVSPANSATVAQEGNSFTVTPSANTTVTINFEAIPTYTVTLGDDNTELEETEPSAGVELPSRSDVGDYTFAGWSTTNVIEETTTAPTIITTDDTYFPTANITLYPVYTKTEGGGASAQNASVTISDYAEANSWGSSSSAGQKSITIDKNVTATCNSGTNSGKYYSDWRIYQNETGKVTITTTTGTLSSVKFNFTVSNTGTLNYNNSAITSGTAVEVSGSSAEFTVGNSGTVTNGQVRITAIEVVYSPVSTTTYYTSTPSATQRVAQPTITIEDGVFVSSKLVTITTETDGAAIQYSTDGGNTWTNYSAPFSINATTTIQAKASKSGMDDSHVAETTFTKETVLEGLSALVAQNNTSDATYYVSLTNAQVTWANGSIGYMEDNTAGVYLYSVTPTLNTIYDGIFSVTYQVYNSMPEIKAITAVEGTTTTGSAKAATVMTTAALDADFDANLGRQIQINNYTVPQAKTLTENIHLYETQPYTSVTAGTTYTLVGYPFYAKVSGTVTKQFRITSAVEKVLQENAIAGINDTYTVDLANNEDEVDLTAATATSGATVQYTVTSSTIDANDYDLTDGVLTVAGNGVITVRAYVDADEDYNGAEKVVTITVIDNPTIAYDGVTESTAYGTPYTIDTDLIQGGDITVSSGNTAVATVDDLTITPVAVGSTTITINTAETNIWHAGTATFMLSVTAPAGKETAAPSTVVTTTFTDKNLNYAEGGIDWTASEDASSFESSNSARGVQFGAGIGEFTLTATGKNVTKVSMVLSTNGTGNTVQVNVDGEYFTTTDGEIDPNNVLYLTSGMNKETVEFTGSAGNAVTITVADANKSVYIKSITLYEEADPITVTLNATTGYATYCSEYPLDFSDDSEFSAWEITNIEGTTITFNQITGSVKGGTGLFLMGTPGATVTLTSAASTTELGSNLLEGTTAPTYVTAGEYFGLKGNEFRRVNAGTIPAGKALLPASKIPAASGVKAFTFRFIDPTTGIAETKTVSAEEAAAIFNLAGQRLQKMQKGINIVNGQKVLVK